MSFTAQLKAFSDKFERKGRDFFIGVTEEVQRSVVEGSEITGAPGQPVQTGNLKNSWTPTLLDVFRWRTVTNVAYAPTIEDLVGITIRSPVGGGHSVKTTRVGWQNIVDHVARRVADG